jgi:ABC-type lipoprotein export system ATPase subunit
MGEETMHLLRHLKDLGNTFILITHDPKVSQNIGTRELASFKDGVNKRERKIKGEI